MSSLYFQKDAIPIDEIRQTVMEFFVTIFSATERCEVQSDDSNERTRERV